MTVESAPRLGAQTLRRGVEDPVPAEATEVGELAAVERKGARVRLLEHALADHAHAEQDQRQHARDLQR